MSMLEGCTVAQRANRRRIEHPLPDPFTEDEWTMLREEFGFPNRQFEVVRFICQAMTDPEIGKSIGLDSNTVRMHVRRILERLLIKNRVGVMTRLILRLRESHAEQSDENTLK